VLRTLIAPLPVTARTERALPIGYRIRPCQRADITALASLYFEAYEPGVACATVDDALDDTRASFAGEYGELWPDASPIVVHHDEPVGAALMVHRAPWPDTPSCPFVIELFTARAYRRMGLARAMVAYCLASAAAAGCPGVALRVDDDNHAARALYASLGFRPWQAR
jgi:N-alpha-acetyltransferase 10/11